MNTHTYYTAVGHFRRKSNGLGQSYPVVIISQREYIDPPHTHMLK